MAEQTKISATLHYKEPDGSDGISTFHGLPAPADREDRRRLREEVLRMATTVLGLEVRPRIEFSDEKGADPGLRWVDLYEVQEVVQWRKYLHRVQVPIDTPKDELLDVSIEAAGEVDGSEMEEAGEHGDDDYGRSGWSVEGFEEAAQRLGKES